MSSDNLLSWGSTQGHILTGGGTLEQHSLPGRDFKDEELPHNLIRRKVVKQTIRNWLDEKLASEAIIGAWDRPVFVGGWMESTTKDTEVFNLQTPHLFVDLRIPLARPTSQFKLKGGLKEFSDAELRLLSRQHCFSGYSYPSVDERGNEVFTRHHFIDWNYHPDYPRSRPNKWWVETRKPQGPGAATESYKEFCIIRDDNDVPIYMERYSRRAPVERQTEKYLVLRKVRTCPAELAKQGLPPQRDAILVVVGRHFCLAVDRGYTLLEAFMRRVEALKQELGPAFQPPKVVGGGPAFIDALLGPAEHCGSWAAIDHATRRAVAEEYLSLEGSYGILPAGYGAAAGQFGSFQVQRSTHPWLEGSSLPWHTARLEWGAQGQLKAVHALGLPSQQGQGRGQGRGEERLLGEWEALDCTLDRAELQRLFGDADGRPAALSLRAKL